jgi:hypothetical protein
MNLDPDEVLIKVDDYLTGHPNATLRVVAGKLGIKMHVLEVILREKAGMTFSEFKDNKRLEQAINFLKVSETGAKVFGEDQQTQPLGIIPKTLVRYRIRSLWFRKCSFSRWCPIVNLNSDELAFLADLPPKTGKRVLLLMKTPGKADLLRLKGVVASALATNILGYRYRVGVKFLPFSDRGRWNTREALDLLKKLEKSGHIA